MVSQRERSPFRNLSDASRLTLGVELNATEHSIATRFFEVRGRLRTPRGVVEEQSLIQRDGLEVRILRRERLVPELPPATGGDARR
jgi:general secretion pathway protein K